MQSIKPTLGRIDVQLYFADLILPKKPVRKSSSTVNKTVQPRRSSTTAACLSLARVMRRRGRASPSCCNANGTPILRQHVRVRYLTCLHNDVVILDLALPSCHGPCSRGSCPWKIDDPSLLMFHPQAHHLAFPEALGAQTCVSYLS